MAPDETGKETDMDCKTVFTNCQPSRTADIVLEYAMNNTRWHQDFGEAFQILIENGYPDGHLVAAGEDPPVLIDPTINTSIPVATDSAQPTETALSLVLQVTMGVIISALL